MKILKKLFLIGLFSMLFLGKANAAARTNFTTITLTPIENYINNNTGKTENDFKNNILNDFELPSEDFIKENYIITIGRLSGHDDGIRLTYLSSDFYQNIAYNYNSGSPALYFRNNNEGNFSLCYKDYAYNTSGNITNIGNWICSSVSTWQVIMTSSGGQYVISTNYPNFVYKAPTWNNYSWSIDGGTEHRFGALYTIPTNFLNGNTYNFDINNDFSSPEPILYEPQIEYFNGYNKVTYYIDNYSLKSAEAGYFVRIVNNTDGTIENISPDVNNINQSITKNYYENVSLSVQVHDREYNILSHYEINTNINYQNETNYSIRINSVSNEQRIVYYDYLIENNDNIKCYYSINNNNFIEDTNCTDESNTYYLQLSENGNITWEIRDLQNNVLYNYSQNFVFSVSNPFINFKDSYNNDFLNLDVLINRYENNDVIEYSINNSQFMQVTFLEDYSTNQNIKYFTINNVNDNDLIVVRVKRNNVVITTAKYRANYLKYSNNSSENFNISDIFNKINVNNINEELKNYIKYFGNLILNSKIGNLLLLETFCLVITIIIKMIRN